MGRKICEEIKMRKDWSYNGEDGKSYKVWKNLDMYQFHVYLSWEIVL